MLLRLHIEYFLKALREKQKAVRESHGPSMRQMKMWKVRKNGGGGLFERYFLS